VKIIKGAVIDLIEIWYGRHGERESTYHKLIHIHLTDSITANGHSMYVLSTPTWLSLCFD